MKPLLPGIAKAQVADIDVDRLLSHFQPKPLEYQEHRRAVECREALVRWPLLADLADTLASLASKKSV